MIAAVLSRKHAVLTPEGNLNNEIGLPLTLLRLSTAHAWGVVELGMNHPGEIGYLAGICLPDIGIITNIGPAHLEGVGSLEGVMRAKGELLEKLGSERTAVLNGDDPLTLRLAKERKGGVLLFGESREADVRAEAVRTEGAGSRFTLRLPGEAIEVALSVPGRFTVVNALAAAAVGHLAGLSGSEIREGLRLFRGVKGRLNLIEIENGVHLIDDTYNANPGSMKAAISTLRSLKRDGRAILVAGDMRELGEASAAFHREIGGAAARSGIDRLYGAGDFAADLAFGAREANLAEDRIFIGGREAILEHLKSHLEAGDWVLVKGSRAMGMESIVQGLREWGMAQMNKRSIGH
jgi:UDP-N-acetylmuramoyl-tripeptide--D-alanyl-D-alanine ligase